LAEQKEGSRKRAYESDVPLKPVYVHGWCRSAGFDVDHQVYLTWLTRFLGFVYDISTGEIYDLNISQGPPGLNADWTKCKRNMVAAIRHGNDNPYGVEGC
jgi:hypothetical protein